MKREGEGEKKAKTVGREKAENVKKRWSKRDIGKRVEGRGKETIQGRRKR